MKVIFLDIDGVLNAADYMHSLHFYYRSLVDKGLAKFPIEDGFTEDEYGKLFDPRCVTHLESIINYTGADIVISSTWRKDGLDKMKSLWRYRELPGKIVGITPVLNMERGEEIKQYLLEHDYITNYVIIDDDSDMLLEQKLNFVQTNGTYGINFQNADKAIKILNNESSRI